MQSVHQHLSRTRSLLRGLAQGLNQQMIYWGFDVQQEGNLLVQYGMEKLPRPVRHREGSSRYQMPWSEGTLELHGFCAGWYSNHSDTDGAIYIRSRGRITSCRGNQPQRPGQYDDTRLGKLDPDRLIEAVQPLIRWWIRYEEWIGANTKTDYRIRCWEISRLTLKSKRWLPPIEALDWLNRFVSTHSPQ